MRLLQTILDSIFPPRETEILVRNLHGTRASRAITSDPVRTGTADCPVISLLRYEDSVVQACIQEAKFEGNRNAAKILGLVLYEFLFEFLEDADSSTVHSPVLIPLPLSRARLRERGYNQTSRIAIAACRNLTNIQIDERVLERVKNTAPQTSCSGIERRTNMKDAFRATKPCDPRRTYIVVDDVITTGNTMLAAIDALKVGGAQHIVPLTLAY